MSDGKDWLHLFNLFAILKVNSLLSVEPEQLPKTIAIMEINYRIIEKVLPPSQGAEKKSKYYMVVKSKGEMDLDAITKQIEKMSSLHGSDIRAVLYALMDVAIDGLKSGYILRLGDLGSLRMIVNSEGRDTSEEVNSTAVKGCKIHFAPSKKLKNIRKEVKFKKMPGK